MSKFKPKDTALATVCVVRKVHALKSHTTHSQNVIGYSELKKKLMKETCAFSILAISIVCVLVSCSTDSKTQQEFRNPNYIWFVPNGESEGRWVEIDYTSNSPLLSSGHCTEFYSNGSERSKYNLNRHGNPDTIFYLNLESSVTHYSITNEDRLTSYFTRDGEFESYLNDGSVAMFGIVEDHNLIDYKWSGKMASFYELLSAKTRVWRSFEAFLKEIISTAKERNQSGALYIEESRTTTLDSLRLNLIDSIMITSETLTKLKVEQGCEDLKHSTLQFINGTKSLSENECGEIIQKMKLEFTDQNIDSLMAVVQIILDKSKIDDENAEKAYMNWSRKFQPGEYIVPLLHEVNKQKTMLDN
ncbi:hypothetical protein KFE98_12425 [bacterium SCSIO 12741]|nr:hypothetical protein KFE98_12425 [bacterium SCSIO 12741]